MLNYKCNEAEIVTYPKPSKKKMENSKSVFLPVKLLCLAEVVENS